MMTEELLDKVNELVFNKEFAAKIYDAKDTNEIQEMFKAEGVEIDAETAQATLDKLAAIKSSDEIAEEDLELVSGGASKVFWTAAGCLVGYALAPFTFGGSIALGAAVACGGYAWADMKKK